MKNNILKAPEFAILLFFTIIFFLMAFAMVGRTNKANYELKQSRDSIIHLEDSIDHILEFSPSNVMIYLKFYDVKAPDTVFKQSLLETGHFTSEIFMKNNNLFGMKSAKQRPTTSMMDSQGHALYRSYLESIRDYKLYQSKYYRGGDYYIFLESHGYSEDSAYTRKIKGTKFHGNN
jgi:hypothetical protein